MNIKIKSEIAIGVILTIVVLIGGIFWINSGSIQNAAENITESNGEEHPMCSRYAYNEIDESLFVKYIVKKGDSLLSISRDELKDVSRVSSIININKYKYSELSLKNPFLEVGWELLLPKNDFPGDGNVRVSSGNLAESKVSNSWMITNGQTVWAFYSKNKNDLIEIDDVSTGDCVDIIHQQGPGQIYTILRQN